MAAPRTLAKKKANAQGRKRNGKAGPGHYSLRTMTDPGTGLGLRASSPRGRLHRLACRIAAAPKSKVSSDMDFKNYTYATPGSLK